LKTENRLKIRIECAGLQESFDGPPDEVVRAMLITLRRIYPSLEIAQQLVYQPDLTKLAETLVGFIQYAPEGMLMSTKRFSSEEAIIISLAGTFVGYKLGILKDSTNSARNLAKITRKALKTISNQLAWMVDDGLVERVGRGEYQITSLGIKRFETYKKNE
jgi:hypothetical protein